MTAVFLAIILPWHIAIQLQHPEFFHFYFLDQHFLRFFTHYAGREAPFWFFIPVLLIGFLPWSMLIVSALVNTVRTIKRKRVHHLKHLFFLLWFLVVFLFFSASHSKLVPYILPSLPPLALLLGSGLADLTWQRLNRRLMTLLSFLLVFYALLWIAVRYIHDIDDPIKTLFYLKISLTITAAGWLMALFLRRKSYFMLFYLTALTILLSLIPLSLVIPYVEESSIKPIAIQLKNRLAQQEGLVCVYSHYYQDLPFYLNRPVKIVDWHNELRFGEQYQSDAKTWLWSQETFRQIWQQHKHPDLIYVVLSKDDLNEFNRSYQPTHILFSTKYDVLLENR